MTTKTGPGLARLFLLAVIAAAAGCPSRDLPPPPAPDEPKPKTEEAPFCGKVFRDAKLRGGAQCCVPPSAGLLKSADVASACGVAASAYLGETRDGAACRLYFQVAGQDAKETYAMVSHPVIPSGAPAPMGPDPLLPWKWKKVALRDALGYEAVGAADEATLLQKQTVLWAGRGRRIVGLHVSKQVCTAAQAEALLQKVIDAAP
jgi:hypothetical protein